MNLRGAEWSPDLTAMAAEFKDPDFTPEQQG
jgi:hypothetical protein